MASLDLSVIIEVDTQSVTIHTWGQVFEAQLPMHDVDNPRAAYQAAWDNAGKSMAEWLRQKWMDGATTPRT